MISCYDLNSGESKFLQNLNSQKDTKSLGKKLKQKVAKKWRNLLKMSQTF